MQAYLFTALAFVAVLTIFVFQNMKSVTVIFLTWESPDIPLALVVILAACAGALVTFLFDSFRHLKTLKTLKDEKVKGKKLASELGKTKAEVEKQSQAQTQPQAETATVDNKRNN
ncbi:MAG: LapA family protein [Ignavibacteriales bacterium]